MDEKRKFLSDRLLSEELPVTYRFLSRALNLHVNNAKGALHDFYQYQIGQRANSVFATYLVSGTKLAADATQTITLVAEDKLRGVLAEYEHVDSLHVYSLAPHAQRDLSLLSDVARAIPGYDGEQAKYGTILNPKARRRERKAGVPAPVMSKAVKEEPKALKGEPKAVKVEPKASESKKVEPKKVEPKKEEDESASSSGAGKKSVLPKRGQKSSIMQSFAKAAARPKPKPAVKEAEDAAMSDDGEADDDLPFSKTKPADEQLTKSRKEREADLRRMMEEYDKKEEEDEEENEDEDEEMEEAEPEPEPEPEAEPEPEKPEIVASSSNGRRRGKRRVMKKKRILDDQGYMVTIQEEGWESFSEEEAARPAPAPKDKKPVSKGGQGSIMSFFAKK